jgi:hypothetical protein
LPAWLLAPGLLAAAIIIVTGRVRAARQRQDYAKGGNEREK